MNSWIKYDEKTHFPVENLPYGVFKLKKNKKAKKAPKSSPHIATRVGDFAVDLFELSEALPKLFPKHVRKALREPVLNRFMALGKKDWQATRATLTRLLAKKKPKDPSLKNDKKLRDRVIVPLSDVKMLLPAEVGDYTDCYASLDHASNVGSMFRDPENPLLPNWRYIPVGYHGRASSVVISGTPIRRPWGQVKQEDGTPKRMPSRLLDFELEVGVFVGPGNKLGEPLEIDTTGRDSLFGVVLLQDASARDIQSWEYVPLGPFTGKNFATAISPWVVTFAALEEFTVPSDYPHEPPALPYLRTERPGNFDVKLTVELTPEGGKPNVISRSNMKYLYWSFEQQLVHHSNTGCNMRPGDLIGSGTISGPAPEEFGSMLELTWKGSKPITLSDGTQRKFINDGDTITLSGYAQGNGYRIGLGEVSNKILPANPK